MVQFCMCTVIPLVMTVGKGAKGSRPPWILKISVKKDCFLSFKFEKRNFTTFGPPRKF